MAIVDPSELDPGIRKVVTWLNWHGFETTDSGDGYTKLVGDWDENEILSYAHVFMLVSPEMMVAEAKRLWSLILALPSQINDVMIEATYSPLDGVATLALIGVDDDDLYPRWGVKLMTYEGQGEMNQWCSIGIGGPLTWSTWDEAEKAAIEWTTQNPKGRYIPARYIPPREDEQ